jgi:hypothetical protein
MYAVSILRNPLAMTCDNYAKPILFNTFVKEFNNCHALFGSKAAVSLPDREKTFETFTSSA